MTINTKKIITVSFEALAYSACVFVAGVFFVTLFFLLIFFTSFVSAEAISVESKKTPNVKMEEPLFIPEESLPVVNNAKTMSQIMFVVEDVNLISNNSLEASTTLGLPENWNKGGYGTNKRVLTYPLPGYNSEKAIKVEMTSYTSGDTKWFPAEVPVTAGEIYSFSDYYISNIPSVVDVRYTMRDGTYKYNDLIFAPANPGPDFIKASVELTVPVDVVSITFFHLINNVGYLTTDEYLLIKKVSEPPPPVDEENLISNPDFEQLTVSGLPLAWKKGGWGINTKTYSYPVNSYDNTNAANLNISKYTSGDAKWYFTPISLPVGDYTYTDNYSSDRQSILTIQYQKTNGTFSYKDIATLPATNGFMIASANFSVPAGTEKVTVFHLINGIGFLTIDNAGLYARPAPKGIFTTGAVTFRFDDGWLSQYKNAIPKLNDAGFKGTFYIVSEQLLEDGFDGFMSIPQILEISRQGHEIGAHTRTHPYLTLLSPSEQSDEILGSKTDLISMGVDPVDSFSYPFGDYDIDTLQVVKNSGYLSAVSVIDGYVIYSGDRYQLERRELIVDTTIQDIKTMIDEAIRDKKWLIFEIHEINSSGKYYSVSKETFDATVNYAVQKQIPVVTVSAGVESME